MWFFWMFIALVLVMIFDHLIGNMLFPGRIIIFKVNSGKYFAIAKQHRYFLFFKSTLYLQKTSGQRCMEAFTETLYYANEFRTEKEAMQFVKLYSNKKKSIDAILAYRELEVVYDSKAKKASEEDELVAIGNDLHKRKVPTALPESTLILD